MKMRLWLILLALSRFAYVYGKGTTTIDSYKIGITNDCRLNIGDVAPGKFISHGGPCSKGVEFLVTQSATPSVFVFRRRIKPGTERAYQLEVYGHFIEKRQDVSIDLEEKFEIVDYEYILRRDGFQCEFADDERGGFPSLIDGNVIHTLVRCMGGEDTSENPEVHFPGRKEEMLALMRSTIHSGLQIVATPKSGLIFFNLPNIAENQKKDLRFAMIPVNHNKASKEVMDSQIVVFIKYNYPVNQDPDTLIERKYRVCNLHEISPDGLNEVQEHSYKGHRDDQVRYIDSTKMIIRKRDRIDQYEFATERPPQGLFIPGEKGPTKVGTNGYKYVFYVTSTLSGTEINVKPWAFRTNVDPISQSSGLLMTSCDPDFDAKKRECVERTKDHQKMILIITILAGFEVFIIIATLIIFSLCIFKQRKRRKLHHERKKARKNRKKQKKDGDHTDTNANGSNAPTSDTKQ